MQFASIITTAARPKPTLEASVLSMRDSGGFDDHLYIFSDGISVEGIENATIINNTKLGGLKSWVLALQYLLENTKAAWLMVLEDDITWASGARKALVDDLIYLDNRRDVGYLSLYLCMHNSSHVESEVNKRKLERGLYEVKLGWNTWGSQALVLPRYAAEALLKFPAFNEFVGSYEKNKNRDAVVSRFLKQLAFRTWFRVPCLVNHDLGALNSALGNKPFRPMLETKYWTGAS